MKNIEFFSSVQGVAETFPVIPASEFQPKWFQKAKEDFKNTEHKLEPHVALCPGIVDIIKEGFIVTAWFDFMIMSDENLQGMYSPDVEKILGKKGLQIQDGDGVGRFLPRLPWRNKDIVKINTPWHIKADCKFLMLPLPYSDSPELESSMGILDPSISNVINVQSFVNGKGELHIKAGTPLCQLIPLTEENYKLIVRDANDDDKKFLEKNKYVSYFGFRLNRMSFRNLYKKFIGSKCPFHKG